MNKLKSLLCIAAGLIASVLLNNTASACSRILHQDAPATLVGRNMDWVEDAASKMVVYPRGLARQGYAQINDQHWTSQYGSLVVKSFDKESLDIPAVTVDGVNEQGFSVELNSLRAADYGTRDPGRPGISVLMWAQFYLDRFASVAEAVQYTESSQLQLEPFFYAKLGRWINLHMSMADASGDTAIIEYIDGRARIYHDRSYKVMTNDPTYDKQLENVGLYIGLGGTKALPGSTSPSDRFVRAAYYEKHLPQTQSLMAEINSVLDIMENLTQPDGIATPERPVLTKTIWRVIADLTHRSYYYQSKKQRQLIQARLDAFNLTQGAPIKTYDPELYPSNTGDVSHYFYEENSTS